MRRSLWRQKKHPACKLFSYRIWKPGAIGGGGANAAFAHTQPVDLDTDVDVKWFELKCQKWELVFRLLWVIIEAVWMEALCMKRLAVHGNICSPCLRLSPDTDCSPSRWLSATWRQPGRHSTQCVFVPPNGSFYHITTHLSRAHSSERQDIVSPACFGEAWASHVEIGQRREVKAARAIRGMEDLLASSNQLVWSVVHKTLRRWYESALLPCQHFLRAHFRIAHGSQVWRLLG